jgi:hypothetical protein
MIKNVEFIWIYGKGTPRKKFEEWLNQIPKCFQEVFTRKKVSVVYSFEVFKDKRLKTAGACYCDGKIVLTPFLRSKRQRYYFLHECGHHIYKNFTDEERAQYNRFIKNIQNMGIKHLKKCEKVIEDYYNPDEKLEELFANCYLFYGDIIKRAGEAMNNGKSN